MKGKTLKTKIANLKRRPIRQGKGSEEDKISLASSWLERAIHPIVVRSDLTVVDGHRRLEGLELLGETEVDVFVTDEELTESEMTQIALATAIHRADLFGYEKWRACLELLEFNPGWSNRELAEHLHLSPGSITHIMSPSKCIPEAQEALKEGKIAISDCYALCKLSLEDQPELLALKLAGASRDTLEQFGRQKRQEKGKPSAPTKPPERCQRVRIPLAVGEKGVNAHGIVTVASPAGKEIDLKGVETLLREAAKAVREAMSRNLGAKAAQAAWRDTASAKRKAAEPDTADVTQAAE